MENNLNQKIRLRLYDTFDTHQQIHPQIHPQIHSLVWEIFSMNKFCILSVIVTIGIVLFNIYSINYVIQNKNNMGMLHVSSDIYLSEGIILNSSWGIMHSIVLCLLIVFNKYHSLSRLLIMVFLFFSSGVIVSLSILGVSYAYNLIYEYGLNQILLMIIILVCSNCFIFIEILFLMFIIFEPCINSSKIIVYFLRLM
jgi:hypothetical protein